MNLEQKEFNLSAVNEMHVACVLLLDTSGSMDGEPINNLNKAVSFFKDQSMMNELDRNRIDIAVVEFNSTAKIIQDFVPLAQFVPKTLYANGATNMGAGLEQAMSLVKNRKALYKEIGTPYFRPWIFIITDGEPTDNYLPAAKEVRSMMEAKGVICWAVGVPGYSKKALKDITDRVFEMEDINFPKMFEWLSNSLVILVNSIPGEKVDYPNAPDNSRVIPTDWD